MSDPQAPDDPYAAAPQPAEPATPQPPAYGGYGQQPPYGGQQPTYGPTYGSPPAYGQQQPPPAYGGAAQQPPGYGPPQPPYTQPAYPSYGYPAAPYSSYAVYPKNSLGIWALVLGIASFVLQCWFATGIAAIIVGRQGQRAADEGLANNRSMSTAGVVLGWVAVGLSVGFVVMAVAFGGLAWLSSSTR